jgi:hypothetical protein
MNLVDSQEFNQKEAIHHTSVIISMKNDTSEELRTFGVRREPYNLAGALKELTFN